MPTFERDDIRLHYAVHGDPDGFPVLCIAPGGMRSAMPAWQRSSWNPLQRLAEYRVIGMDQRNAGQSWAPVRSTDGWAVYTADQVALLDHLGVDAFHVIGMCIGGPYILGLARAVPERLRSAVMLQPIGLHHNRAAFEALFDQWAEAIDEEHPEADEPTWQAFRANMFGSGFVFNATREQAAQCDTPILLFQGDDRYHPAPISRELADLLPEVQFVRQWKDDPEATDQRIRAFLAEHTA